MSDIEAPIRASVRETLAPWFDTEEEVPVQLRDGHAGIVDVLAIPKDPRFRPFPFAIEVKARRRMVENGLAAWIKQASDYVGAVTIAGHPVIGSAFLWMVGMEQPDERDQVRLRGMLDVAHQFRVGAAVDSSKRGFEFRMGPDEVFRSRGWPSDGRPNDPWPGRALERLTSSRQSAGQRRTVGR